MGFLKRAFDFVVRPTHSRTMGILVILVLVSAVSLTIMVAQKQQTLKQHASEIVTCSLTFDWSNNISAGNKLVESGPYKILLNGESDRVGYTQDTHYTFDNVNVGDRKYFNANICGKDALNSINIYKDCLQIMGIEPVCTTTYSSNPNLPVCGNGLTCFVPENGSCNFAGANKCLDLSNNRFGTAEKVARADGSIGKIVCCNAGKYSLASGECTLVEQGDYTDSTCTESASGFEGGCEVGGTTYYNFCYFNTIKTYIASDDKQTCVQKDLPCTTGTSCVGRTRNDDPAGGNPSCSTTIPTTTPTMDIGNIQYTSPVTAEAANTFSVTATNAKYCYLLFNDDYPTPGDYTSGSMTQSGTVFSKSFTFPTFTTGYTYTATAYCGDETNTYKKGPGTTFKVSASTPITTPTTTPTTCSGATSCTACTTMSGCGWSGDPNGAGNCEEGSSMLCPANHSSWYWRTTDCTTPLNLCPAIPTAVPTVIPTIVPTTIPTTCVTLGGRYSGSAGTFDCCNDLVKCSNTGTCETSCSTTTGCLGQGQSYLSSSGNLPCCTNANLMQCVSMGSTCQTIDTCNATGVTLGLGLDAQDVSDQILASDPTITLSLRDSSGNVPTNNVGVGSPTLAFTNSISSGKRYFRSNSIKLINANATQGQYLIFARNSNNMIAKSLFSLGIGQTAATARDTTFVFGDLDNNNDINTTDFWGVFRNCWNNYRASGYITPDTCRQSDFDQSGTIDQVDYNIFLRGFATWNKEGKNL